MYLIHSEYVVTNYIKLSVYEDHMSIMMSICQNEEAIRKHYIPPEYIANEIYFLILIHK
jgi:hypothetical protein